MILSSSPTRLPHLSCYNLISPAQFKTICGLAFTGGLASSSFWNILPPSIHMINSLTSFSLSSTVTFLMQPTLIILFKIIMLLPQHFNHLTLAIFSKQLNTF